MPFDEYKDIYFYIENKISDKGKEYTKISLTFEGMEFLKDFLLQNNIISPERSVAND